MNRLILALVSWALLVPGTATAAPANVFFIMDTSASMNEADGDGTKLDRARAIVRELALAAEGAGHRVSLMRYRQRDVIVPGGEGPRTQTVEDPDQCRLGADVLVPLQAGAAGAIESWVDGEAGQGVPEVVALGDSPLYASTRVFLRYVDGLRELAPELHCVSSLAVIITDGEDSCAGGAELLATLDELEAVGANSAIQTLVISFDPDAEAAQRLAAIGREEADPRVFGVEDVGDAAERLSAIVGRPAIEACGGEPEPEPEPEIDAGAPDMGTPDVGEDADECVPSGSGTGGCSVGGGSGGGSGGLKGLGAVFVLFLALLWRRRRHGSVLLVALALSVGCGDDDDAMLCVDAAPRDAGVDSADDARVDATDADANTEPPDPDDAVQALRLQHADVRAALERARDAAQALVDPTAVFDAIEGDPTEGCRALLETIAYVPYAGAQRGVRGCLATRACGSLDQSLLLQACLEHHGVVAEVRGCRGTRGLADVETFTPSFPDFSAIDDPLVEDVRDALSATPAYRDELTNAVMNSQRIVAEDVVAAARRDVELLMDRVELDADAAATTIDTAETRARDRHFFVAVGDTRLDPILSPATDCFETPLVDSDFPEMNVQLVVQNVEVTGTGFRYQREHVLMERSVPVHAHYADPIVIALGGAEYEPDGGSIPPPSEGGCFRGFIDGEASPAFPLIPDDTSACLDADGEPLEVPAELLEGSGLGRVVLRTEISIFPETRSRDRVLIDRYGYATSVASAVANGPAFSRDAARRLIPMRVDLEVGGGIPGPHEELARLLEERTEAFEAHAARGLIALGAPTPIPDAPPPAYVPTTLGLVRDALPELLDGHRAMGVYPWRMATVARRVFVPGRGISKVNIFDLIDVRFVVPSEGDVDARLRANMAIGAAFTEAERIAGSTYGRTLRVLHAGALLRESPELFMPFDEDPERDILQFPFALQAIARTHERAGETLLVTPGPVEVFGSEITSWWRVDPLGNAIGDIRYEGTLYGGVAEAKAVATFTQCLANQAIVALTGPRVAPDVSCCAVVALISLLGDLATGWLQAGAGGGVGMAFGGGYSAELADQAAAAMAALTDMVGLYMTYTGTPECVRTF